MNDPIRYAKKDVYADVVEEGGTISRLVAVKGQPVSPAFADYVKDSDTTTDVNEAHELARTSAARRANVGERDELDHEAYREAVQSTPGHTELSGKQPEDPPAGNAAPPAIVVDDLAIADYDELTLDDVLGELGGLSPDDLAKVKEYEAANEGRFDIVNFEPAPELPIEDYDELNQDQVLAELAKLTPEQVEVVKAYEAENDDRKGIREFEPLVPPVEGYDELNQKQVLARLEKLSADEVKAVKAYEAERQDRKGIREFEASA